VKDAREFFAYAKANPGKVNYGSFGTGSISHIWMELLSQRAGVRLTHVPYKGAAPALQDLAGGQVAAMLVDYGAARGFISAGKINALAVTTRQPHPRLPGTPTLESLGIKDYDIYGWVGAVMPAGTPRPIVDRVHDEMVKAAPEVTPQYSELGINYATSTPEQFAALIRSDMDRWAPVIKALNIQLD
jgi:tripartite-type tricarboxylate transporter receptor subunit TctC